mmetsp:Transcript_34022/g.76908  ORF Transcript_34022/g.76908 Transcript_34022/m.76908 type:complete len:388 (+) Transcript_34022:266-1429(+)
MGIRDLHETLPVDDVEAVYHLHVQRADHLAVHLADQAGCRRGPQPPLQHIGLRPEVLEPGQLLELHQTREVAQLSEAHLEGASDQVLVEHPAVLALLRVGLHVLEVGGEKASHGSSHRKGGRRDHVLPRQALHDVKVKRDAVVQEALRSRHVQHHHLEHAEAEGALKRVAPSLEVLHERGKHLQCSDGLPVLVEVHKVRHLGPRVFGGRALLGERLGWWDVRAIVVQEGSHMQGLCQVDLFLLQGRHDVGGLANVTEYHHVGDTVLGQVDRRGSTRLLVEVHPDHGEGMVVEHFAAGCVRLHVLVDVHQEVTISRPRVHDEARLGGEVLAAEDDVEVAHEILEEGLMLSAAAYDVQGSLDVDLRLLRVLAGVHKAPARVLKEDGLEL